MRKMAVVLVVSYLFLFLGTVSAESRNISFFPGAQWKKADSTLIVTEFNLEFDGYNPVSGTSDVLVILNGSARHFRAAPSFTNCPTGSTQPDCNRCALGGIGRNYWLYGNNPAKGTPEYRFFNCNTTAEGAFLVDFVSNVAEALVADSATTTDTPTLPAASDAASEVKSCLKQSRDFVNDKAKFKGLSKAQKRSFKTLATPVCSKLQVVTK